MTDRYEKFIGFDQVELKFKKERGINKLSGNEEEILVKRTPEEIEAYKQRKEQEFDGIVETWRRLGIEKCALRKEFDQKKFNKIYLKLVADRLDEISELNNSGDVETNILNSLKDVDKKYKIGSALRYYSVKEDGQLDPYKIFKGKSRADIEKLFYRKMSMQTASNLARNRLTNAKTLKEGIATLQELQKTHDSRSIFFKIFHPFKNAEENRIIREMKTEVMNKFKISKQELDNKLGRKIDKLSLKNGQYKLDDFIRTYCKEDSGKLYSQRKIDGDSQDVAERAENDFVESQMELDRILKDEVREPIVVDDAKNKDEAERSRESVVAEDPLIIKVPKNDKF